MRVLSSRSLFLLAGVLTVAQVPGVVAALAAQELRSAPLSTDPLVFGPAGPVHPGSGVVDSARPAWRGVKVAPELECSPFDAEDYGVSGPTRFVPQVTPVGAVEGRDPLTCAYSGFTGRRSRFVTVEEAHRRGLCRLSPGVRRLYVVDARAVMPGVVPRALLEYRRSSGPGWLPPANQCWYVRRRLEVHQRWGLAVPRAEADRFEALLALCPVVQDTPWCLASAPPGGGGW